MKFSLIIGFDTKKEAKSFIKNFNFDNAQIVKTENIRLCSN